MNSQLEKNQRYTLIKMDSKYKNLDQIKNDVLSQQHKEPFKSKLIEFSEDNEESYFLYKWYEDSGEAVECKIPNTGETVNYLCTEAICEFSTRKIKDANNEILPKKDRLNVQKTEVIFAQKNNQVFAILMTFDNYELKRIKKLIRMSNIEPLPSEYQIVPSIFTWLFYKYITEKEMIDNNISIEGINGFTGNVLTDENRFSGDSGNTPDLIITKAFLANNYDITSIKVDLNVDSGCLTSFYINQTNTDNELRIMALKNSTTNIILNVDDIYEIMPLYIIFYLIPQIFDSYQKNKNKFDSTEKNSFLADLAVEVVKQILARNNLTKDDL